MTRSAARQLPPKTGRQTGSPYMSEEFFRLVVTIGVALACIAFLVQAGVVIALYGVIRKLQDKMSPLVDKAEPVVAKMAPFVDQAMAVMVKAAPAMDKVDALTTSVTRTIEENRPKVLKILTNSNRFLEEGLPKVNTILDNTN